ncbi:GPS motif protein [Trinorchestia longiramus]|nr:GPS motif protein [Trinorchestia longiramus]
MSHVSCHCDHLTNFAVLMDFHATPLSSEHTFALAVITYVGCIISIVCLLLAIVVFHVFKGLQSDRTSIHKNLCACLLVAEIIFLGGINQTGNRIACGVIAGLLHYFFLAAFAWMFMEGLQLYLLLVEVFEAERSRLKWYCLASYGAPAIVVVVSLGIDPLSYGTPQVCWLRTDNNFIFAFIGPVAVVLLANAVFLVLSLVVLCRHTSTSASLKNKEHTKLASVRTWLRGAFVLVFLLGLTWTFGLLYLNQQTVVMAYIFTVLNALQGLFIFIFHCIQNDKVKKEMRGACRRHAWLRACLCDYSHGLNTPSSSVVSKPDTRANSLRRHPSLSPSAVLASATHPATSVGNTSYHHQNNASSANGLDNQLQLQQQHQQQQQQHFLHHSNVTNATLATDTLVTSANSSPLHHAHIANLVSTHHPLTNNLDHHHHHHHHPFPKLSHGSNSSYSEQVLIERPNNFSVPTSPSLSSSQTSSSASELNTSFGGPHQDPNHAASYQNFLAFRAQQLNAAQIYASPPGTPMSQLYDTAGPCIASSNCDVDSSNLSMDPRFNIYQPCGTPESHLYIQPQSYPRPSAHPQRSMHEPQDAHNVATVKVSALNSNGVPRSMTSTVVRNNYLNLTPASTSHSVPTSPENEEIHSKRPNAYPLSQPVPHSRNLKTIPHSNTSRVIQNSQNTSYTVLLLISFPKNPKLPSQCSPKFQIAKMPKYSFKSCGRDSGHGGSEQDESPRSGTASKLTSLRLNNNVAPHQPADRLVNSFAQPHSEVPSPEALLPDYRLAGDGLRLPQHPRIRNQSPYNHTYTEISEGSKSISSRLPADPVYEEIEREGRLASELQVSDMSDEDGRRLSSDVSRQSSRSYGDHRPLLPYTLPDHLHGTLQHIPHQHFHHIQHQLHQHQLHQNHIQQIHMQQQHQLQQQQIQQQLQQEQLQQQLQQQQHLHQHHHHHPAQMIAATHPVNAYETRPRPEVLNLPEPVAVSSALTPRSPHSCRENLGSGIASVVQPLSEPNLRNWEAVQHRRDMAQLQQHLGEMTVAVLNGEQVVCKLKSPLTPIQEAAHQGVPSTLTSVESAHPQQQQLQEAMQVQQQYQVSSQPNSDEEYKHSHAGQANQEEIPVKHQQHKHPVTSLTYSHC